MKIIFIRHGDPDYKNDTLTARGHKEAEALAKNIDYWKIDDIYVSPLGRAKCTAGYILEKLGKEEVICDWLREFDPIIDLNEHPEWIEAFPNCKKTPDGTKYINRVCWDIVPDYLNKHPEYYENPGWRNTEMCIDTDILDKYDYVCSEFDKILAKYGYVRENNYYRVEKENEITIAMVCHFGLISVLLSHLINASPYSIWHGTCLAPTSVTRLKSEERQKGKALFRAQVIGDFSHLLLEGIEVSPAASFTEVYSDMDSRH